MNFEVPALYDINTIYKLKVRDSKASEVTIKGVEVTLQGLILESKYSEITSEVDLTFKFNKV
jgi:hypothetical protein